MAIKVTKWDSSEYLETKEDIAEYLSAALDGSDLNHFSYALSQVAKAKGMTELSKETGIPRTTLYKMFEENRNPEFTTIKSVIDGLGLKISITPQTNPR